MSVLSKKGKVLVSQSAGAFGAVWAGLYSALSSRLVCSCWVNLGSWVDLGATLLFSPGRDGPPISL